MQLEPNRQDASGRRVGLLAPMVKFSRLFIPVMAVLAALALAGCDGMPLVSEDDDPATSAAGGVDGVVEAADIDCPADATGDAFTLSVDGGAAAEHCEEEVSRGQDEDLPPFEPFIEAVIWTAGPDSGDEDWLEIQMFWDMESLSDGTDSFSAVFLGIPAADAAAGTTYDETSDLEIIFCDAITVIVDSEEEPTGGTCYGIEDGEGEVFGEGELSLISYSVTIGEEVTGEFSADMMSRDGAAKTISGSFVATMAEERDDNGGGGGGDDNGGELTVDGGTLPNDVLVDGGVGFFFQSAQGTDYTVTATPSSGDIALLVCDVTPCESSTFNDYADNTGDGGTEILVVPGNGGTLYVWVLGITDAAFTVGVITGGGELLVNSVSGTDVNLIGTGWGVCYGSDMELSTVTYSLAGSNSISISIER